MKIKKRQLKDSIMNTWNIRNGFTLQEWERSKNYQGIIKELKEKKKKPKIMVGPHLPSTFIEK